MTADMCTLCPKCLEEGEVTLAMVTKRKSSFHVSCEIHGKFWFVGNPMHLCVGSVRHQTYLALKHNLKVAFWLTFLKAGEKVKGAYHKVMPAKE